jgi:N utilization substance protein B
VTINEYIDIAKSYSTQQSGQFVNGILDGIHKDLQAAGKLKKIDFKK